jgi:hypothetical protein
MSRRNDILLGQLRNLFVETREARKTRDNLRDNAAALLAAADAEFQALRDERDDLLVRLNTRLVADGLPELTLDYFKDMP